MTVWTTKGDISSMGVQKEDVEKFLQENPAFAKQYFSKKMSPGSISKASGLPENQVDFSQFQELCQVKTTVTLDSLMCLGCSHYHIL